MKWAILLAFDYSATQWYLVEDLTETQLNIIKEYKDFVYCIAFGDGKFNVYKGKGKDNNYFAGPITFDQAIALNSHGRLNPEQSPYKKEKKACKRCNRPTGSLDGICKYCKRRT